MSVHSKVELHEFEVLENEACAKDIMCMRIRSKELASKLEPGQFLNLRAPGDASHILRVPLSFVGTDKSAGTIELIYAVVGTGTRRLQVMKPGEMSDVVGPCGNGWWLPEKKGRALLVAGGVGLPPIMAAAHMLIEADFELDVIVGAQSKDRLSFNHLNTLESLLSSCGGTSSITTDDGTYGTQGFTTTVAEELLQKAEYASVYTCGPTPMMAGIASLSESFDVSCQTSLEQLMSCGFGACSTCNVAVKSGGYKSCCMDGPVFDGREVIW